MTSGSGDPPPDPVSQFSDPTSCTEWLSLQHCGTEPVLGNKILG